MPKNFSNQDLNSHVMNLVKRAKVTLVNSDQGVRSGAQVQYMGNIANVETIYPYGFYANAPLGSNAVLLNIQAEEENRVAFVYDSVGRYNNLLPGEVKIGNTTVQSNIYFDSLGNININPQSVTGITNINSNVTCTGTITTYNLVGSSFTKQPVDNSLLGYGPSGVLQNIQAGTNVTIAGGYISFSGSGGSGVTLISTSDSNITLTPNPITSTGTIALNQNPSFNSMTLSGFSTAGVVHNNSSGNLSSSLIVNNDITNGTIDLTSKVVNVLPIANGGTGLSTTPSNGQLQIGNGSGYTLNTLTAGSGIAISNSSGGITISATGGSGTVTSIAGDGTTITTSPNPITTTGTISIYSGYVGQSSITTLGTIATGVWEGTQIGVTYGGTGLTSTTANQILYSSSNNTIAGLTTADSSILVTDGSGVPSLSTTLPSFTASGNILANSNNTIDIGQSGTVFNTVYATTFSGTANQANYIDIGGSIANLSANLVFVNNSSGYNSALINTDFTVNASTGVMAVPTLNLSNALEIGYGGTGVTTIPSDGDLLIGNGSNYSVATLTAGTGVSITNGSGSITISATGGTGTVTSITAGTGLTGGTITTSGTIALSVPVSLTNGGTNASLTASDGGIVWSNSTQLQILSGTSTANQVLLSGSTATPAWSTATYPATTTVNQLLYSSSANTIAGLSTADSSILVTNASGVPSLSTTLPAFSAGGNIVPTANQTYNLGSSSDVWATVYTNLVAGNAGQLYIEASTSSGIAGSFSILGNSGNGTGLITITGGNNSSSPTTNNVLSLLGGSSNGGTLNLYGGQSSTTANNILNIGASGEAQTITVYGSILTGANNTYNIGASGTVFANMYATTFNGALNGNASTATTATNATNVGITSTTSDTNYYITGSSGSSGNNALNVWTDFYFNPYTQVLTGGGLLPYAGNSFNLGASGQIYATLYINQVLINPASNSTTALNVTNTSSTTIFNVNNSSAQITLNAGQLIKRTAVAASTYSALATDFLIAVNYSGACTVTLPASSSGIAGQIYVIKDESGAANTNNITIEVSGGGDINGNTSFVITQAYGSISVYTTSSQWYTY